MPRDVGLDTGSIDDEKEFLLPDLHPKVLSEKFSTPLFLASVRMVANTKGVLRQLGGWAGQFSAPPQRFIAVENSDGALSDDERQAIEAGLRFVRKPIAFAQFKATMAEVVQHAEAAR
jgi:hypothetical protein